MLESLTDELNSLVEQRDSLAGQMRFAADRLEASGLVDLASLSRAVESYRGRFEATAAKVSLGDGATLDDIRSAASRLEVVEPASSVLARVARLEDSGGVALTSSTRALAESLLERFNPAGNDISADDLSTAGELANGSHVLNRLLTLVEDPASLPDDKWNQHVESVRGAFGSDVATAAIRGRLGFASEPAGETAEEVTASPESIH